PVHNDRAVAEGVCGGRFTHAGVTLELGTEPDWLGAELPRDEEWRIEWSKFYFGLDLANAFRDEGDPRFLRAWEGLVGSWIRQVEIGRDSSDVAARRMQNWVYAWSMFAAAPGWRGLRDGLDAEILSSLSAHVRYVRDNLTPDVVRNHRTLELYALFVVALSLPEIDPRSDLLNFTIAELHRVLEDGFRPDGVHRESSTHYHLVVLRSLLGARENARRFELRLPKDFDAHLERACEFALHCHRPDGVIPALSDADSGPYPEVLSLAADLLDRPDFGYAATAGARGCPPTDRYVSFPSGGYFVQRSGWGSGDGAFEDERFLIFDCGPLGDGGHGHYDLLSVEAFAHGRSLVVDPGRYTYSEEGANLRRWFKGTAAHNTVCVDGLDQTPYRRGRPGKRVAGGHLASRRSAPGFDMLEGTAESPCYDALHTRRILFVADEYWLIEDRLRAEQVHRYDLRWHLPAEGWKSTRLETTDQGSIVVAPGLALAVAGAGEARLEDGWVSPRYGIKMPAPVVSVRTGSRDARFVTLVAPRRPGWPVPRLRVRWPAADQVTVAFVEGVDGTEACRDVVAWSTRREQLPLGSMRCVATAAWLRSSAADGPASFRGLDVAGIESAPFGGVQFGEWVAWDAGGRVTTGGNP
ncbi:MAG: heparinase II/III domain-containing protein, partial [Actinomycetota bacterium]